MSLNEKLLSADDAAEVNSSRLEELRRTGLLDSEAEEAFDRLTRLASRILRVPVALVSLVDEDRQFFKSQVGLPEPWASQRQTPLSHSFCKHVIAAREALVVGDARQHPLVRENLAVAKLGVVAYAGVPLTTTQGHALGAFCVIDSQPREWTDEEISILRDLTASAITEIELKLAAREARRLAEAAEHERQEKSALLDSTADGMLGLDAEGRCKFINQAASRMFGYSPEEIRGVSFHWLAHHSRPEGSPHPEEECPIVNACRKGRVLRGEDEIFWHRVGESFSVEYLASPVVEEGQLKGAVVTITDITRRKKAARRLAIQHAVSEALARATCLAEAAPQLLQSLGEALEWQLAAIWTVDEDAQVLRCSATWKAPGLHASEFEAATRAHTFACGQGFPGRVWATGEPVWSSDILQEQGFLRAQIAAEEGLHGAAFFPLLTGTEVLGVIEFFSHSLPDADATLFRAIKTAGHQIGQFMRRERAQEELRNSEALKGAVIQMAMDCVILMDHRGRILEWNPATEKTFGHSRDQVLGREITELIIPPSLRDPHRRGLRHYLDTGEGAVIGRRIEITGMRADGSEFPAELAITAVNLRGVPVVAGYLRDITDRKIEEARQQEQMRLAALTADVGVAISQSERLGDMLRRCSEALVQHLDGAFARIWTLNPQEHVLELQASAGLYTHVDGKHSRIPVGQYKIGLIAEERQPHLTNTVAEDPRVSDPDWARQEGMVAFAGYPLLVGEEVVGVMGMFARKPLSDLTLQAMAAVANSIALGIQRIGAEIELKRSKEAADEANHAKSQFLATMSHELRTPLNAVILYSELLIEEAQDLGVETLVQDLEKIRNAGKHLLGLINNVLDLSKIEAGKMELFLEEFEVFPMVQEVAAMVRPLADKRSNRLEITCSKELGQMRTDLIKVRQVLFNLLNNASKFTENGMIHLEVEREPGGWVMFKIRDSGIGMTEEQLEKLFQAFTQADASTTRKYGGTGLGLVISKRLCEMLGGDIDVQSRAGEGSTVTVRIPARADRAIHEPSSETGSSGDSGTARTGTVLVIDDDPAVRDMMTRLLVKEGYRAVTADSAEPGLRLAREVRPDLITLDVIMPRTDGWAVLAALKADQHLAAVPVIMLTMVDDRNLGYMLGASEYITKPIDRARLSALLEKYRSQRPCCRVLVAEDDHGTRRMLRDALIEQGCEVIEAENGREAITRLGEALPDLILLDLLMPEMDGFELASELRRRETWRGIPIVVITAKDVTSEERLRLNGNIQKILQKGAYARDDLLREISKLVKSRVPPALEKNSVTNSLPVSANAG